MPTGGGNAVSSAGGGANFHGRYPAGGGSAIPPPPLPQPPIPNVPVISQAYARALALQNLGAGGGATGITTGGASAAASSAGSAGALVPGAGGGLATGSSVAVVGGVPTGGVAAAASTATAGRAAAASGAAAAARAASAAAAANQIPRSGVGLVGGAVRSVLQPTGVPQIGTGPAVVGSVQASAIIAQGRAPTIQDAILPALVQANALNLGGIGQLIGRFIGETIVPPTPPTVTVSSSTVGTGGVAGPFPTAATVASVQAATGFLPPGSAGGAAAVVVSAGWDKVEQGFIVAKVVPTATAPLPRNEVSGPVSAPVVPQSNPSVTGPNIAAPTGGKSTPKDP